jgi:hypothetical protein
MEHSKLIILWLTSKGFSIANKHISPPKFHDSYFVVGSEVS